MSKVAVMMAPPKVGGDAIELSPLENKIVAIFCKARDERKTKFGPRKMTAVAVVAEGSKEPLEGIMFQTYFQDLELGFWYIGRVVRVEAGGNKQWVLSTDNIDPKAAKALAKTLESVKIGEIHATPVEV